MLVAEDGRFFMSIAAAAMEVLSPWMLFTALWVSLEAAGRTGSSLEAWSNTTTSCFIVTALSSLGDSLTLEEEMALDATLLKMGAPSLSRFGSKTEFGRSLSLSESSLLTMVMEMT
jgi:hypothetical protein